MKKFVSRLSKTDRATLLSLVVIAALAIAPALWDMSDAIWVRSAMIALAASSVSAIVLGQMNAREESGRIGNDVGKILELVDSSISEGAAREVPSSQIAPMLDEMLSAASEWYFRGGSARWQRQAVLPALARIKHHPVDYRVQIISPFDEELCAKYAVYRGKSRPGDERADPVRIQLELLSFIYASAVWSSKSKIVPRFTLLHRFSPFRLDGNSSRFLMTIADPASSGLTTARKNWFHSALLDEFEFEAGYATALHLPQSASDSSPDDVRVFFEQLCKLNPEATGEWSSQLPELDWSGILELAETKSTAL